MSTSASRIDMDLEEDVLLSAYVIKAVTWSFKLRQFKFLKQCLKGTTQKVIYIGKIIQSFRFK